MAGSLNKVMLIGNLGADPEVRMSGRSMVASFRVACTETWKDDKGQRQERTEWVTCVCWNGIASFVQNYIGKGTKVYVEGKLQTRTWEDKNGGGKRYATEVLVAKLDPLAGWLNSGGERPAGRERHEEQSAPQQPQSGDDDLPF